MVALRALNREALTLLKTSTVRRGAPYRTCHLVGQERRGTRVTLPDAKVVLLERLALTPTAHVAFGADASIPVALPTD